MVISEPPVSENEKREALDAVLASQTFARSAQLRAFLRYVCEAEIAGRAQDLTEYQIAVDVLGRRKDFELGDDSSVRNRAYELRQRLERYYGSEQPNARIRIEIPRGGYAPVYTRHPDLARDAALTSLPQRGWNKIAWIVAVVAVICGLAGWLLGSAVARNKPAGVLAEAWGPMASSDSEMLICIATNLHMLIRPHIPPRTTRHEVPRELYQEFTTTRPLGPNETLYMEPAQLSIPLGELAAAATLASTKTLFGGGYQILPESEAPITALLGRNSVLIGTPVNSRAASVVLRTVPLTIGFTPTDDFAIIDQRRPAGQGVLFTAQPGIESAPKALYGLLTVLTSTASNGRARRTLSITGTGSAGVQGAVEFFCSAARMRELRDRMGGAFPPNYQVVVRCTASGLRMLSYEYQMHVVVDKAWEAPR